MNAAKRQSKAVVQSLADDEDALWSSKHDAAARARLIEIYLPFSRIMAAKLFAARIESDIEFADFLQFATIGLIEAVDRFDPIGDAQFKTYAAHRIQGAVLNGLDHLSEKRQQIATQRQLLAERRDSGKAVLEQPELDLFQKLAEMAVGLAIGFLINDEAPPHFDDAILPENHYAGIELRQLQAKVRSLVDSLPQRERMVIKYHYLNHVPFHAIAEIMDLSKGRVSQLHRQALNLLRERIKNVRACDVAW